MHSETRNSSGLTLPVSASPRMTTAAVPGQQADQGGQRVGQHPHRRRARGVVEHRERHRGDHPHRQHRRPAAFAQPRVQRVDPGMPDQPAELPAGRAHQQQRDDGADGAGQRPPSGDAEDRAEQQARGQRERGAREREDRHHDVGGRGTPAGTTGRPRSPSRAAAPRWATEPAAQLRRGSQLPPAMATNRRGGTVRRRRDHRGTQCAQGADDGFHAYQDYGPRRDNTASARVVSRPTGGRCVMAII